ncbi:MAG: tRNA epoxyqueuosine(34) reductase QueG [Anaerolineaceae bacterium]|nr:tRNA epoxyqueuosine(34) reductase QueG [Anaerolineaceae bacterium]
MSSELDLLKQTIKAEAINLGFCVIGFSSPTNMDIDKYQEWIDSGQNSGMKYLANPKTLYAHQNPSHIFSACKSIISLGALFPNPAKRAEEPLPNDHSGIISSYAYGEDYHQVLSQKIQKLMIIISEKTTRKIQWISAIDATPLAERELAIQAGLGWIAKNSMFTNPEFGSAMFLCEILVDIPFLPDKQSLQDYCGKCTKCIDACPTNCINANRTIDANRCLSYLTIEHRGLISEDFFQAIDNRIFGCDICLAVCPWNANAKLEPRMEEFFPDKKPQIFDIKKNLPKLLDSFHRYFAHRAIRRAGKLGFLRNCMIRLANSNTDQSRSLMHQISVSMPETYLEEQLFLLEKYLKQKGS